MTAIVLQGDARHLPLPDASVDLICTSPPFWSQRDYRDAGVSMPGQIGSEATWQEWLANLLDCTREWVRVLKPDGNLFVELGDKFSASSNGRSPDYAGVKGRGVHRPGARSEWTNANAAWLAAVLDCEGSVSGRIFTNSSGGESFVAWMRVGMMDREVVERIYHVTGVGQVFQDKRGAWNWHVASQAARYVLERIWPWLVIKQKRALAAIELCRHVEERAARGFRTLSAADLAYRAMIVQAIRDWNGHPARPNDYEPPVPAKILLPHVVADRTPPKCLLDLPHRYSIACVDQLGLIKRANIVWHHTNGLPESVTDRVRVAHTMIFHLVKQPRYYTAIDEIREPHTAAVTGRDTTGWRPGPSGNREIGRGQFGNGVRDFATSPLGKLPGSVWNIPSQPLQVPAHLGVDHFAAWPMEVPRRLVLGWSPPGICVGCGQGRRPVVDKALRVLHTQARNRPTWHDQSPNWWRADGGMNGRQSTVGVNEATITGYVCACPTPDAPTRPSVILDPFGGTGTTALVASMHGRVGVSIDRSADYTRLAAWRTRDPAERAKALQVPKPPPIPDGQDALFTI